MRPTSLTFAAAVLFAVILFSGSTINAGPERVEPKSMVAAVTEPEPFSWTGFYVGGHLGAVWSNIDIGPFTDTVDVEQQFEEFGTFIDGVGTNGDGPMFQGFDEANFPFGGGLNGASGTSGSNDSFIGGGQLGYQRQFGHFVIGVEGDFSRLSTKRTDTFADSDGQTHIVDIFSPNGDLGTSGFPFPFPVVVVESLESQTTYTATRSAELEWQASARAKLGWASDKVLLYVTGGAAFAEVKTTAIGSATTTFTAHQDIFADILAEPFTNGPGIPIPIFGIPISSSSAPAGSGTTNNISEQSEILTGWTGGGGGEYALNDKVSIGVEYRHSDFGSHTFVYDSHGGAVIPGSTTFDIQNDQVTVRFNILLSHFFGH